MTVAGINARVSKLLSVSCGRRWTRLGRKEKAVSPGKFLAKPCKHWYSKIFCYFSWQRIPRRSCNTASELRQLSGEKAGVGSLEFESKTDTEALIK